MAAFPHIRRIIRNTVISPIQEFIKDSRAVGITLLACTIISLVLANTAWSEAYLALIDKEIHLIDALHLPHTFLHWINDGLMAVFFFQVGMEIKRELLIGELSSLKKASLPITAALGGMLVPALIYLLFNKGTAYQPGWGIPMATDIAFSLGVASLLGARVPVSLKIFLMALAIIDDLGAIVVIAVFYGGAIDWIYLLFASGIVLLILVLNKFKMHYWWVTLVCGMLLWYCVFNSGIHPTIAGVIVAFLVPLDRLSHYEHRLHDIVNFIILPLFALANTAIIIPGNFGEIVHSTLSWGVLAGLVIGKPLGISLFAWITIKMGWGDQPSGTNLKQIIGIGTLAGIGFTMSIFITMLAFQDAEHQNISKLAILIGAVISIVAGLLFLNFSTRREAEL